MSHLQRELWSLCGPLQGLLTVVGLQHHVVPLLRIAVRMHKVREALWMTESIQICSEPLNKKEKTLRFAQRAICFTSYLLSGKLRKSIRRVLEMWKHLKEIQNNYSFLHLTVRSPAAGEVMAQSN